MKKYSKFLIAAAGVVLTGLSMLYGHNQTVQLIISVATAVGVYRVPNEGVR